MLAYKYAPFIIYKSLSFILINLKSIISIECSVSHFANPNTSVRKQNLRVHRFEGLSAVAPQGILPKNLSHSSPPQRIKILSCSLRSTFLPSCLRRESSFILLTMRWGQSARILNLICTCATHSRSFSTRIRSGRRPRQLAYVEKRAAFHLKLQG